MVFYIWSNDGMINEVKQALEEAVQRGVKFVFYSIPLAVMLFWKALFVKKCEKKALKLPKRYM